MYQKEWKKLLASLDLGETWRMQDIPEDRTPVRVKSTRVADKGATGILIGISSSMAEMRTEAGSEITLTYQKLELISETGEIESDAPRDMLGEAIVEGCWVTYSQGRYRTGHDLEIGRVKGFTKRGTIEVEAKVKSGEKLRHKSTSTVNPERCVKLPVDVPRMMMAILTDFDSIDGSHD